MKDKRFEMRMNEKQFNLLHKLAKSKNFTMSNYMLEFLYKESDRLHQLDEFDLIVIGISRDELLDG
jgi:uncharacterized protein (DUF1778 family)